MAAVVLGLASVNSKMIFFCKNLIFPFTDDDEEDDDDDDDDDDEEEEDEEEEEEEEKAKSKNVKRQKQKTSGRKVCSARCFNNVHLTFSLYSKALITSPSYRS